MSGDDRFDLVDWLTLKRRLDFSKARWLGPLFAVVATLLVVLAIGAAFTLLVRALFGGLLDIPGSSLGVGGVTVALIGAPFVIWRSIVAQKQADISEQGLITDRINKAVEGLGSEKVVSRGGEEWTEPSLEVRIGAIYALERISQDSERDHIQIMEILCAYIRQNAKTSDLEITEPPFKRVLLRVDLQAAIDVIGRRSEQQKAMERRQRYRLDLRGTNLSFANFTRCDFSAAVFVNCKLEACQFRDANLSGALLNGAVLNFSDFFRCNLTGARLDSSKLNRPIAQVGGWTSSINMGELKGVSFPGADISALQYLGPKDKMNQTMGSKDTVLSPVLRETLPPSIIMEKNIYRGMPDLDKDTLKALEQIENAGFKYWFPFDAKRDMAFGSQRVHFLRSMGLDVWPYLEE